jgi:hypothetical protein
MIKLLNLTIKMIKFDEHMINCQFYANIKLKLQLLNNPFYRRL